MPGLGPGIPASGLTRMQTLKPSPVALPPALIYAAALTCGVVAALALQVYLSSAGFDPAALWENLFTSGARQLRTAGPWWAIAGVAFVTSGITAAALSRFPPPWQRFRLLRWVAGTVIVVALAQIGHPSAAPETVGVGINVAANLVALAVAAAMALLGAYVAVRR
jgi:hypothetical protein